MGALIFENEIGKFLRKQNSREAPCVRVRDVIFNDSLAIMGILISETEIGKFVRGTGCENER